MNNENEIIEKKTFTKKLIIIFFCFTITVTIFLLYSRYIETKRLIVKEYRIENEKITNNFHGLKIVHISDIHYGRTVDIDYLKKIVNKINYINPDIVVLTGDLIDKDTNLNDKKADKISKELNKINAKIGKYAIKGNHDYKFDKWNFIIENSGFIDLDDNYDLIYKDTNDYILLSGMSTNIYGDTKIEDKLSRVNEYLNNNQNNQPIYKILLMHEPDFIDNFDYTQYDLILAGHSHNGQVRLPFIGATILPPYGKKYYDNYYKLNNTELYISSGIGVSSINFRFLNPPSINFYRLTHK